MRHGINLKIAQQVAYVTVNQSSLTAVENILRKMRRPHIGYCPSKDTGPHPDETFIRRHLTAWLPTNCFNGSFVTRVSYFAVSHVWGEGIRADSKGRDLTRDHLTRIFDALAITGAEWIWLDVLAMPNADPEGKNLSPEEKTLQVQVINTLPQMCDASSVDVAIGLICGAWISRVWTYQEIRLAKKALVITADRTYTWNSIIGDLRELVDNDDSRQGGPPRLSKFYSLFLSMAIWQYVGKIGLSLTDISFASATRQSTYEIDYARSLFALVNLPWDPDWATSAPGMQAIYQTRRQDAARLVAIYGVKRLNVSPRWAPSRLAGLEGTIHDDMIWEDEGLRGAWHRERIVRSTELKSGKGRRVIRLLLSDQKSGLWCEVFVGADEEPDAIKCFNGAVLDGRAFLICKHQIADGVGFDRGTASQALVVETIVRDKDDEVDVIFATALRAVSGESRSERRSMLLKH
ncbi:putative monocarboxylate transporter [Colletotrichum incanum]|nr:putative monocarboxylate transporter [Colletotrichum incanum]